MKHTKFLIYTGAWLVYIMFSFFLFPQLKITVMPFSIPLTMLGGWLFLYRGAQGTTLATIPVHYLILSYYADDPSIIYEALNPFGIASQLLFSCCTALLKISQNKYDRLNETLEEIVTKRTEDLENLTNYLIDTRNIENIELNASLLEMPYKKLKNMLETSELLENKLNAEKHPRAADAHTISSIIRTCLEQLETIEKHTSPNLISTTQLRQAIDTMIQQMALTSSITIQCQDSPEWDQISSDKKSGVYEIIFEAASNAIRHAEPSLISICLETKNDETHIHIENDGKPFMTGAKEGMGLPLMRYRAGKIGGNLFIAPTTNNLTRISCVFPANSENSAKKI